VIDDQLRTANVLLPYASFMFVEVAKTTDLPVGRAKAVLAAGRTVAL